MTKYWVADISDRRSFSKWRTWETPIEADSVKTAYQMVVEKISPTLDYQLQVVDEGPKRIEFLIVSITPDRYMIWEDKEA